MILNNITYKEINSFIGRTVKVRFFTDIHFFIKQIDETTNQEIYRDVNKKVPSIINGIAKACTEQTLILGIMDEDEDRELAIKIKNISYIKPAKIITY